VKPFLAVADDLRERRRGMVTVGRPDAMYSKILSGDQ
jgi:hypothetical protein